jgi:hypothetical protein
MRRRSFSAAYYAISGFYFLTWLSRSQFTEKPISVAQRKEMGAVI